MHAYQGEESDERWDSAAFAEGAGSLRSGVNSRAEATPTNLLANGWSSGYPADVRARLASAPDAGAGADADAAAAEAEEEAVDAVLEDWAEAAEEEAVDAEAGASALRFCPPVFGLRYSGSDAVICFLPSSARKLAFISVCAEGIWASALSASCQVLIGCVFCPALRKRLAATRIQMYTRIPLSQ